MKYLIPLLAGALLMWLFLQTCNKEVAIDTRAMDSIKIANDSTIAVYKDSVIKLQVLVNGNDIERNRQQADKEQLESRLTDKIAKLTFTLNKYRTAKEGKDTLQQLINCDEIVIALDSIYSQALLYKLTIDSLQTNGRARRALDSTGIAMRDKTISELQGQVEALQKLLRDAINDNASLRMALSRSKRGRWLLAGLGVVIGGLIGHSIK